MELTLDQALQKGIEAHKAGQVQEADRYYTAILKASPKHPDANHNMGVLAVGVGKVNEAILFFKAALEANPSITQFWLSYIDALIKLDRIADARAVCDQAKSKGGEGNGFDQIEQNLVELEKATKVNAASVKPKELPRDQHQSLVNLYKKCQYKEALNKASQLLEQFPNSINLYNILGGINKQLGKLDEAIEAYKKALLIKPDYADAYYNMGNALKDLAKLEEAIQAYKKAISIKPDYADAYYNMGNALKEQGKLYKAIEAYSKATSIKPNNAEVYISMGSAFQEQGKLDEAIRAYKKALSIKPDYTQAIFQLGKSCKQLGLENKAIKYFEQAQSLDPEDTLGVELELVQLGQKNIPSKTPQAYMKEFYKKKANRWDKISGYNGHILIKNAFNSVIEAVGRLDILDLGCGTGSLASYLRPYSKNLDGVDLSPDMLNMAKETGLYDALYQQELESYLQGISKQYDVVVAAAVLIHFFDLQNVLSLLWNSLRENGKLIFSVFEGSVSEKELNKFLMYSHSKEYIDSLANSLGFEVTYQKTAIHEYQSGKPITALVYVLRK